MKRILKIAALNVLCLSIIAIGLVYSDSRLYKHPAILTAGLIAALLAPCLTIIFGFPRNMRRTSDFIISPVFGVIGVIVGYLGGAWAIYLLKTDSTAIFVVTDIFFVVALPTIYLLLVQKKRSPGKAIN